MKRVILQPAYVLHRRAYRETSFLVDFFTLEYGCITAIAKGVRKLRSATSGLVQAFIPVLISFAGKTDLMSLTHIEMNGEVTVLRGECLFAGFYLNELLVALLQKWDPHPTLYHYYVRTLTALQGGQLEQKVLRSFEKYLLEELGYGLLPKSESVLHRTFSATAYYRFIPEQGFILNELSQEPEKNLDLFSGSSLLAMAMENWQDQQVLSDARRLMRLVLTPLLGTKMIHSRRLFMSNIKNNEERQ